MSVLTFKSEEYKAFPPILKEYASYQSAIKGNAEKTVCEYLLDLRTFFRYYKMKKDGITLAADEFIKISISDITLDDARAVNTALIIEYLQYAGFERENSTTTRTRKLSSMRSFFRYLHGKKHLIETNPTEDIDSPKKKKVLPKHLSFEESVLLLKAVKNDRESSTRKRDYCIIVLFLNTGMRLSELVGLNLENFDRSLEYVKVRGKGNKERIIYLNDIARDALRSYLSRRLDPKYVRTEEHALFISRLEKRISGKTVQWMIYKYLDLAGLGNKGISVHKLRHTAATLMYQSGKVDIRLLKEILGHEQLNTTQIYTHVVNSDMQAAMKNNPLADMKIKADEITSEEDEA